MFPKVIASWRSVDFILRLFILYLLQEYTVNASAYIVVPVPNYPNLFWFESDLYSREPLLLSSYVLYTVLSITS